ncbi:MAG: hypothetical protein ACR2PG_06345 [Hyphomicrobiaceae bacterium]
MQRATQTNIARAGLALTAIDAAMTASFGWMVASSSLMKPIYFGALGGLSTMLAFLPVVAAAMFGRRSIALSFLGGVVVAIYIGGFVANFFSNYGLTAAIFKSDIVAADHANRSRADARAMVQRLRARDAELTRRIALKPAIGPDVRLAPEAYAKLIETARLIRDNEARRGGCGPLCEAKTKELKDLEAAQANAVDRLAMIAERRQVRRALADAEVAAASHPPAVSVAKHQAEALASLLTQRLDLDKSVTDWTLIYVAAGISVLVSVFAHLGNLVVALNLAGVSPPGQSLPKEIAVSEEAKMLTATDVPYGWQDEPTAAPAATPHAASTRRLDASLRRLDRHIAAARGEA